MHHQIPAQKQQTTCVLQLSEAIVMSLNSSMNLQGFLSYLEWLASRCQKKCLPVTFVSFLHLPWYTAT